MTVTRLWSTHPDDLGGLTGEALRRRFVLSGLFTTGEVSWGYAHDDRMLVGGLVVDGHEVALTAPDELKADHLLERRELGVVGIAGTVRVVADGATYDVGEQDVLYLPMGTRDIISTPPPTARPSAASAWCAANCTALRPEAQ